MFIELKQFLQKDEKLCIVNPFKTQVQIHSVLMTFVFFCIYICIVPLTILVFLIYSTNLITDHYIIIYQYPIRIVLSSKNQREDGRKLCNDMMMQ